MLQKSQSKSVGRLKYLVLLPLLLVMLTYVSCSSTKNEIAMNTEAIEKVSKLEGSVKMDASKMPPSAVNQKDPIPYAVADQAPIFPGCENLSSDKEKKDCTTLKFRTFVNDNFNWEEMKAFTDKKINRIDVQFKITTTGDVEIVRVRATKPEFEAETKRVFSLVPQLIPGKFEGEEVAVLYAMPIVFKK